MSIGLLLGIITVKDNGLELAWGVHTANNLFLSLFITHESSAIQTDALLFQKEMYPVFDLITLIGIAIIFIAVCWKVFKWNKAVVENETPA